MSLRISPYTQVETVIDTTLLDGRVCFAHSDPHINTFDQL